MLKFLVLGDFHYKKNMYASTLAHLAAVLARAKNEQVDFVIHTGDFCNDYQGSQELLDAYLNNIYALPVFGIYGNHELETRGNTMSFVTPKLGNQQVVFADVDAGYWYYDIKGYRLIGLDTNYSYNESTGQWEHNLPGSWGPPAENIQKDSLSPAQLSWLDSVLAQAHTQNKRVIIFSHTGLSGEWASSPDAQIVRDCFSKYPGTVVLSVNGHLHCDHFCVKDSIAYFDVNAAINGFWMLCDGYHYAQEHTFTREKLDDNNHVIGVEDIPLNTLTQSRNTWYFTDPLSAVIEISDDGKISIEGAKTQWMHGVLPPNTYDCIKPEIPSRHA